MLASDVTHYYEHMDSGRPFTTTFHVGDTLEGYDRLRAIAPSPDHIVPGHDPLVMRLIRRRRRNSKAWRCGWTQPPQHWPSNA